MNITLLIANYAAFILTLVWSYTSTKKLTAAAHQCRKVENTYGLTFAYHNPVRRRIKRLDRLSCAVIVLMSILTLRFFEAWVASAPTGQKTFSIAAVLLAVQVAFLLADRIHAAKYPIVVVDKPTEWYYRSHDLWRQSVGS